MTIADAFAGTLPKPAVVPDDLTPVEPVRPIPDPAEPTVDLDSSVAPANWLVSAAGTVAADLRGAWLWDTHGPSARSLWDTRIPPRDAVPGANQVLWLAWCVYNHAALLALFPLMFLFWAASHPARLLYAAPIAAPLTALWLT